MLWLLTLIIISLSVDISSNLIIVNSTTIDKVKNNNNFNLDVTFLSI